MPTPSCAVIPGHRTAHKVHTRCTLWCGSANFFLCLIAQSVWRRWGVGEVCSNARGACFATSLEVRSEHRETHTSKATPRWIAAKFPSNPLFRSRSCPLEPFFFSLMAPTLRYTGIAAKLTRHIEAQNTWCSMGKMLWQVWYFVKMGISLHRSSSCWCSTVYIRLMHIKSQSDTLQHGQVSR